MSPLCQGTAGCQYSAGGQCRVQSGAEVPEDPPSGGAGARSSLQTFSTQHPLSVYGAGLPYRGRGQSASTLFWNFSYFVLLLFIVYFHSGNTYTCQYRVMPTPKLGPDIDILVCLS